MSLPSVGKANKQVFPIDHPAWCIAVALVHEEGTPMTK